MTKSTLRLLKSGRLRGLIQAKDFIQPNYNEASKAPSREAASQASRTNGDAQSHSLFLLGHRWNRSKTVKVEQTIPVWVTAWTSTAVVEVGGMQIFFMPIRHKEVILALILVKNVFPHMKPGEEL